MQELNQQPEKDAVTKISTFFCWWISFYSTFRQYHFCPVPLKTSRPVLSNLRNLMLEEPELIIYSSFFLFESRKCKSLPLNHIDLSCLRNFQGSLRRPAICILITFVSFREMMYSLLFQMSYFGEVRIAFFCWKLSRYSLRNRGSIIQQAYQDTGLQKNDKRLHSCIVKVIFLEKGRKSPKYWKSHRAKK